MRCSYVENLEVHSFQYKPCKIKAGAGSLPHSLTCSCTKTILCVWNIRLLLFTITELLASLVFFILIVVSFSSFTLFIYSLFPSFPPSFSVILSTPLCFPLPLFFSSHLSFVVSFCLTPVPRLGSVFVLAPQCSHSLLVLSPCVLSFPLLRVSLQIYPISLWLPAKQTIS